MLRGLSLVLCAVVLAPALGAGCPALPRLAPDDDADDDADDTNTDGNGDDDALPADRYCEELVEVFCPFYVRCGRMDVQDVAGCRAVFPTSCEARFEPRFLPLADAGLLTLSSAGLAACAEHLATVPCDQHFFELSGPCAGIWRGNVEAGGACGLDVETFVCAPGTACTLDLSFCGTCERVLDPGAVCRVDDTSADAGTGPEGTCGPAGLCGDDDVCVARPQSGARCDDAGPPCALPARCDDDGVCREPLVVAVGAACDASRRCPYLSACVDGVCVASAAPGEACGDDGDCEASFCDDGVCAPLWPGGAACTRDAVCASGRCADGTCAGFAPVCVGR
jgi:hypothetical protein